MPDCTITREIDRDRVVYRVAGAFDRAAAWSLRDQVEREAGREVQLDFSLVRDFSDLGVAVLAHGLTTASRRVVFSGLRQHQLRVFRYCGVAVDELAAREVAARELAPDRSAAAKQSAASGAPHPR